MAKVVMASCHWHVRVREFRLEGEDWRGLRWRVEGKI
jgi:hypothetical protein